MPKYAVTVVVEVEALSAAHAHIEVKTHMETMETTAEDGERFTVVAVEEITE